MKILLSLFLALLLSGQSSFGIVKISVWSVSDSDADYLQYVRHLTVPPAAQTGATWDAGNNVSGKSAAEVTAIVNAIKLLESDPVRKEIYTKMKAAPTEIFAFNDVPHAKEIFIQRLETIAMMKTFNTDHRYDYWDGANPPHTTATNWTTGPKVSYYFRQKSGTAYQSIEQLCAPGAKTYGDCWGAVITSVWWGASRGMGESAFNTLYPGVNGLDISDERPSWKRNLKLDPSDVAIHVPGDMMYFQNFNYALVTNSIAGFHFYKMGWLIADPAKKLYYSAGENALYYGQGKYGGLGTLGVVSDVTQEQMREGLRNDYNNDLKTVIDEVKKLNPSGTYNNMTIKEIAPDNAPQKITITNLRRVKH